jgi:hypothetical protein
MNEAAPQAASIRDLVDWEALAALLEPVTLGLVREAFPGWHTGQDGEWLWAVLKTKQELHPHSLLRPLIVARTPTGLATASSPRPSSASTAWSGGRPRGR